MKITIFIKLLNLFSLLSFCYNAYCWGFLGHEKINNLAVFTLPPDMIKFYKENIDYITSQSTAPDKRRYSVKEEAPRHYLDSDHYGVSPFDSIPKHWNDAVIKFSEDTLEEYGILPWHINKMFYQLTTAFKERDAKRILKLSSEIGHYIADANVPLHTTENYNGQLTDQIGIHGFWESRLPELFSKDYNFFVGRAQYIDNPLDDIWKTIELSFSEVDSVLIFEKELNSSFPSDLKYSYENKGNNVIRVYSQEYSENYNKKLDGMVERKMCSSIISLGSFWYTAWVNAGQPDLNNLYLTETIEEVKENNLLNKIWKNNKIFGRQHED